jgi:2-polyprenyl-3-methyl-5-hydroxy-6-metoxy-1,4-benzoquinol methylase
MLKSCEGHEGGDPVAYFRCSNCGFCHAPDMCNKPPEWFREHIYNADYDKFDPEYHGQRADRQATHLIRSHSYARKRIRHLDFGSGDGRLTERMIKAGFDSTAYDPFVHEDAPEGVFNLITCFEVFEHVPAPQVLMKSLSSYLAPEGLIMASTVVSDGEDIGKWWYASPRNGHISLYSGKSLCELALQHKLDAEINVGGAHYFYRKLPDWAIG